jgi:hypothetical protein
MNTFLRYTLDDFGKFDSKRRIYGKVTYLQNNKI